jgi:hypothetical protein
MGFKKEFFVDCVGAVTVLVDDRVVFQGQIIWDDEPRHHDDDFEKKFPPIKVEVKDKVDVEIVDKDPDFIALRLTCDPAIIKPDGYIEEIEPDLFEAGDIIRINVNEIIAVGPSRCCLGDSPDA